MCAEEWNKKKENDNTWKDRRMNWRKRINLRDARRTRKKKKIGRVYVEEKKKENEKGHNVDTNANEGIHIDIKKTKAESIQWRNMHYFIINSFKEKLQIFELFRMI